jgi:hypothetical protein
MIGLQQHWFLGGQEVFPRKSQELRINSDLRHPPGGGEARALIPEELASKWETNKEILTKYNGGFG